MHLFFPTCDDVNDNAVQIGEIVLVIADPVGIEAKKFSSQFEATTTFVNAIGCISKGKDLIEIIIGRTGEI